MTADSGAVPAGRDSDRERLVGDEITVLVVIVIGMRDAREGDERESKSEDPHDFGSNARHRARI